MARHLQGQQSEQMLGIKKGVLLTVHNQFHIVHESVDDLQNMRLHHAGLVLGEPVQTAQYVFDLAVP